MSSHSHETLSDRSTPAKISSSEGVGIIPRAPSSPPDPSKAPPPSTSANTCTLQLACPVPTCPLVLKGETPHRYLRRHLKYPGLHGRTGQEKEVWLNLHKIEHERLLATLEDNKAEEEERESRIAEFESRAKSMGITGEKFVAQKVAIWEGMWAAKRSGDDIGYDAWVLLDAAISAGQ